MMPRRLHRLDRLERLAKALGTLALAAALALMFVGALVHWIDLEGITSSPAGAHAWALAAWPASWWRALKLRLRLTHTRLEVDWMEDELQRLEEAREHIPALLVAGRQYLAELRVHQALLEQGVQP